MRNIVILLDGTSNQLGPNPTNIIRLAQVLEHDPERQIQYYDTGIGTLPETRHITRLGATWSIILGLAFGAGLYSKVLSAYRYLLNTWQFGDRVFIFGFSRGAYAARMLASMLYSFGLLRHGNDNLLPFMMPVLKAIQRQRPAAYADLDEFRWTFARPTAPNSSQRRFTSHFMGLWDTVSSVGWIWDTVKIRTFANPGISIVRHAMSIDERRAFFGSYPMSEYDQDFQQVWFAGSHCDVGGGYTEREGGLWRVSFQWMLNEARDAGLLVDEDRLKRVLSRVTVPDKDWLEPIHESLRGAWWLAEIFPRRVWSYKNRRFRWRFGFGARRQLPKDAIFHESVKKRIAEGGYSPPNLLGNASLIVAPLAPSDSTSIVQGLAPPVRPQDNNSE